MARVVDADVVAILGNHYDSAAAPSLTPFITPATLLVDRIHKYDTNSLLDDASLAEIEKYLAAHFYALQDQILQSKGTNRASGSFQGQTGKGLDGTQYGQMAKVLDETGYLARMDQPQRPKASLGWLGKRPSEQTDYEDRD